MKEQNLQSVYLHKHGGVLPINIATTCLPADKVGMNVQTTEGAGSEFTITLPFKTIE